MGVLKKPLAFGCSPFARCQCLNMVPETCHAFGRLRHSFGDGAQVNLRQLKIENSFGYSHVVKWLLAAGSVDFSGGVDSYAIATVSDGGVEDVEV
jgi:hypothetical protein